MPLPTPQNNSQLDGGEAPDLEVLGHFRVPGGVNLSHPHRCVTQLFVNLLVNRIQLLAVPAPRGIELTATEAGVIIIEGLYSPVNRTGSPQGFSLDEMVYKLNTIPHMHITIYTNITHYKHDWKVSPFGIALSLLKNGK